MNMNQILLGQSDLNAGDSVRRRRTPSKYAESIKQLTKIPSKSSRKQRNQDDKQDETPPINNSSLPQSYLNCILPTTNRKLKLSIVIKKNVKPKIKKSVSLASIEKEKDKQKQKSKNISLLDTLFQVVEQYKADEQNKKQQLKPMSSLYLQPELPRKQSYSRKHKEEQQKYCKYYDKYRILCQKLERIQNQIIYI